MTGQKTRSQVDSRRSAGVVGGRGSGGGSVDVALDVQDMGLFFSGMRGGPCHGWHNEGSIVCGDKRGVE